jgi:hypothetical protein
MHRWTWWTFSTHNITLFFCFLISVWFIFWQTEHGPGMGCVTFLSPCILHNQSPTAINGWYSSLRFGCGLTTPHSKKEQHDTKCYTAPRTWTDPLKWPKQWKMDVRFVLGKSGVSIGQVLWKLYQEN